MITVSDLGLAYSGQPLFSHVDLQFTKGNCYGIIGANGAGKSTFLKILSGELEPTSGEVSILPKTRSRVSSAARWAWSIIAREPPPASSPVRASCSSFQAIHSSSSAVRASMSA